MITVGPRIEERAERPYVAIRTRVTLPEFGPAIPRLHQEVFGWLRNKGVAPAGPPFIRYLVIDMAKELDVELGVPVATPMSGDDRVSAGVLPAGRYAALVYKGDPSDGKGLMEANGTLLAWGEEQGLAWDSWAADTGEAFGARLEWSLTDPAVEPDMSKWETEVAIRLADGKPR